ncbi:MAG: adenine deaminase C-terminal domain-containing protein [Oscillospiraceae bacterium]|nr:adenine deaminase C-terminal domain-containing protein [Oscillospiraceae bacterium]
MRTKKTRDRSRLIAAAMQQIPCDLTVENVRLVNVFTGEVYPASVDVLDGYVVRVREEGEATEKPSARVYNGHGAYLIPGFIDAHMHVESTMMIPENLGRAILPWGTTTVCTDPHEIGNVTGVDGVKFMLANAKRSALRQYVLAPSCVPAVPDVEGAGASFGAKEVGEILDLPDVVGIAEIMDFVGVYRDNERMHTIVAEGDRRGMFLQGHAPMVHGKELAAYRLGGPISDHECNTAAEVSEKLRNGVHINLRASSIIDNLTVLLDGCKDHKWRDNVSICTDDVHAKDLLETGHINAVFAKAVKWGADPIEAVKWGTINAAREYGFDDLGAIAPGYIADMQLVDELDGRCPNAVFWEGVLAAENGVYLAKDPESGEALTFPNTVNMPQITCEEDFLLKAPAGCGDTVKTLVIYLENDGGRRRSMWVELPVKDGYVSLEGHDDLQYCCIANRHGSGDKTVAIIKDFGLKEGAIASTISHDSHNFTVMYKKPSDALAAAKELARVGGGMCAVKDGKVLDTLKLPVAGLMSPLPCKELSAEIQRVQEAMAGLLTKKNSLLMVAVFALPVVPGVVVTDKGMVDGFTQKIIPQFEV